MTHTSRCSFIMLLAGAVSAAWACGVCVEDKVAATYDWAVVQQAMAKRQVVVFCELAGPVDRHRITTAARQVHGLEPASLRISPQPPALSFAIEGAHQSPHQAVAALQRALPAGTRVKLLKVVTANGFEAASAQR